MPSDDNIEVLRTVRERKLDAAVRAAIAELNDPLNKWVSNNPRQQEFNDRLRELELDVARKLQEALDEDDDEPKDEDVLTVIVTRSAGAEQHCGRCGHPIVLVDGRWIDPNELLDNTPELCLMNEPEPDYYGPHEPFVDQDIPSYLQGLLGDHGDWDLGHEGSYHRVQVDGHDLVSIQDNGDGTAYVIVYNSTHDGSGTAWEGAVRVDGHQEAGEAFDA